MPAAYAPTLSQIGNYLAMFGPDLTPEQANALTLIGVGVPTSFAHLGGAPSYWDLYPQPQMPMPPQSGGQ